MQLNIINARFLALIAPDVDARPLAGDQLHVDLDLSGDNLPPGTRLAIGDAVIEVTDQPHTGCAKFSARFGADALKFVNSPLGRELHLRGINAKVVQPGTIRRGDTIKKVAAG
jgi:MOSC domain-containing protein YiiM